ncbi:MAG: efflux RND transporter periplasmic adaptor subunit [Candidatus Manganitrophus sp.]|nr:MAG: efflux RND transporter periplasmic adaptor subunit [Candidatus Manganitrophus sp.]
MEILLLLIYAFFVWLIFFKLKWLPWNFVSQAIVITLPFILLAVTILLLNVVAPSSHDVRVINYVVQILPQVRGRVIDVPVEPNKSVKKGDVLFRVDPTPFELEVKRIEAQLALAETRLKQSAALAKTGAGSQLDVDRDRSDVRQLRAQLDLARWNLSETTTLAPGSGKVINLQLREGSFVVPFPVTAAMSFVEDEQWVIALFSQNELRQVKPGDEAEIILKTYPGRVIKGRVDAIVWATGQGQLPIGGTLPQVGEAPAQRFAVKLMLDGKDRDLFLAPGARGAAAIYTEQLAPIHLLRKVLLRVSAKLDWFIVKLH